MTDAASDAAPQDTWSQGWLSNVQWLASPNFGPRPQGAQVDLIVLHSISLPPGVYGGCAVEQLFTNQLDWSAHPYYQQIEGLQVSAHFYIRRDGRVVQFVSCDDRAWHAGKSCYRGRANCNDDSVGIELEGLAGSHFERAQYQSLVSVCDRILARYPITHIAGHEHIAPGRKFDPGQGFDWSVLARSPGLQNTSFPAIALANGRSEPPEIATATSV
ncbi:MAG: 1,6-anhydro-N-acetylmuramyl-L-alanine amidase AmpD [Rhodoferax sp.]|nr:1,6-anhydro-N-acetylmuramyl-L-alanine amidase AmpD [Rhodoferax sp.]